MLDLNFKRSIDSISKKGRINKRFELFLNLTYKCPLRCTYCYVDYNRAPPMTQEQVDYVIEKLIIQAKNPDIKLITFFGGEPALEMDIIENTVKKWYGHPKMEKVHFGIITSFSVHQKRLLNLQEKHPNVEIAISFDVDMKDRPYVNGKKFDLLAVANKKFNIDMDYFARHNNNIFFNKVITGQESNLYDDLMWLHETYKKYGIFYSLSFTKTPKFPYDPAGKIRDDWFKYIKNVLDNFLYDKNSRMSPMLVLQYLHRYWEQEQGVADSGCGLGGEYFIDSKGTISPCSISHHKTDLMIYHEGKFLDNYEHFQELEDNYWNNPTCQSCKYKGFCPGGCMVFRYTENKDYNKPNEGQCILMREIFEAYEMYLKELSEEDEMKLRFMSSKDLSRYYEYCQDKTTQIDLRGIYNNEHIFS